MLQFSSVKFITCLLINEFVFTLFIFFKYSHGVSASSRALLSASHKTAYEFHSLSWEPPTHMESCAALQETLLTNVAEQSSFPSCFLIASREWRGQRPFPRSQPYPQFTLNAQAWCRRGSLSVTAAKK